MKILSSLHRLSIRLRPPTGLGKIPTTRASDQAWYVPLVFQRSRNQTSPWILLRRLLCLGRNMIDESTTFGSTLCPICYKLMIHMLVRKVSKTCALYGKYYINARRTTSIGKSLMLPDNDTRSRLSPMMVSETRTFQCPDLLSFGVHDFWHCFFHSTLLLWQLFISSSITWVR